MPKDDPKLVIFPYRDLIAAIQDDPEEDLKDNLEADKIRYAVMLRHPVADPDPENDVED